MGRWLAARLDGAQHWILHDRDPYLLHFAAVASPRSAADGSRVTVETRRGDVARLTPDALNGASLVTASALLDVLTREEVGTLAAACAGAGCPALLTLSVAGRVELDPVPPAGHGDRRGVQRPPAPRRPARPGRGHGGGRGVLRARRDRTAAPEPLAARPRAGRAHRAVAARLGRRRRRGAPRAARARRRATCRTPGRLRGRRAARRRPPQRPAGPVPAGGRSVMSPEATAGRASRDATAEPESGAASAPRSRAGPARRTSGRPGTARVAALQRPPPPP